MSISTVLRTCRSATCVCSAGASVIRTSSGSSTPNPTTGRDVPRSVDPCKPRGFSPGLRGIRKRSGGRSTTSLSPKRVE